MKPTHVGSQPPRHPVLSSTGRGFLRDRKQQLMKRLSRHADVVYVNPTRAMKSRDWPFLDPTRQLSPNVRVARIAGSLADIGVHIDIDGRRAEAVTTEQAA